MENKSLVIIMLFIGIITIGYFTLKPKLTTSSLLSEEECIKLGDDCWHSLAHQTLNKTYCNEIKNNKTKEHCFEHIPK